MTATDDFIRQLEGYLDDYEGSTPLSEGVRDAIRAELPTIHQRPAWLPARRFPDMNTYAKLALAAAFVTLAVALGYAYLAGPNIGGPEESTAPSATVGAEAPGLPQGGSSLEAGPYRVSDPQYTPVTAELVVPDGWFANDTGAIAKNADTPAQNLLEFYVVTHVYADACDSAGTLREIGPAAEDLVRAILEQQNTPAVGPTDVTVGGYPAQRVDLGYPTQIDDSQCRNPGIVIQVWADEAETSYFALPPGNYRSVYVVDVNGERVVFTAGHASQATDEDRAELQEIIDSIRFPDEP